MVKAHHSLAKELGKALRDIADLARDIVRAEHDKTGRLLRSIQPYKGRAAQVRMEGPTTLVGTVSAGSSRARYARAVHEGSRRHIIRARPGGALSFIGSGRNGRKTFSRTTLRLATNEELDQLSFNEVPGSGEYDRAYRRRMRRHRDWNAGRNSFMRHRDADVFADETEHDYASRRVVVDEVNHPGYKGHRFLNEAAAIVIGRRYGRGAVNLPRRPTSAIRPR